MYCPKCSQQLLSDELRFCSRCGFPLAGVALLLENNGVMPEMARTPENSVRRRRIIKESALLTLASWVVALMATLAFDWGGSPEIVAKVAALIFFILGLIGLLRFLYAFLFVKGETVKPEPALTSAPRRAALPSPQDIPLSDYPRSNTREMVPRVSVTENTTQLLDKE